MTPRALGHKRTDELLQVAQAALELLLVPGQSL